MTFPLLSKPLRSLTEAHNDLRCPKCNSADLEQFSGQFDTGVVAPDGGRESTWEEGYKCQQCGFRFDFDDAEEGDDEPSSIPFCCFCGKATTWDPTYQDLCYRCIRADNE